MSFDFPVGNLGDFAARWAELEASRNPFAVVIMAQLKEIEAKGDNARKFAAKRELILGLYERGFSRQDIRDLFRVVDYLITLPEELETELREEIHEYEEEKKMLISSWERMAKREGVQEGIEQLIHRQLTHRFGELDSRTLAKIKKLSAEQLEDLGVALFDFAKVKDLKDWLARLNGSSHNGAKANGKKRASAPTRKQVTKSRKR